MRISIVIVTYNRIDKLLRLLESIDVQSRSADEIIIWDDGSTDNTEGVLRNSKYFSGIRYFYSANGGIGFARAQATPKASGDIIFVLDSDDIIADGALEKIEVFFSRHDVDVMISDVAFVDSDLKLLYTTKYPEILSNEHFRYSIFTRPITPFKHIGLAFRKSTISRFGNYDPELTIKVDIDLVLKWVIAGAKFKKANEIVSAVVLHGSNASKNRVKGLKAWGEIINKYEPNIFKQKAFFALRVFYEMAKSFAEQLQNLRRPQN